MSVENRIRCGKRTIPKRRGATLPLIAILLPVILAAMFLAIDTAYMELVRTELRAATDAAARAGAESLARTASESSAVSAAQRVAGRNLVAGLGLVLDEGDVTLGRAISQVNSPWEFRPGERPFNAVRVEGRRTDDSASGSVSLLLSKLSGVEAFEPWQTAIAAQADHDVAIVFESSGSMHAPNRWPGVLAAVQALSSALALMPNGKSVCVVECHNNPYLRMPMTKFEDASLIETFEQMHRVFDTAKLYQARNVGGGIQLASDALAAYRQTHTCDDQTIIFLGNGNQNKGLDPSVAAQSALARGQVMHAFVFGRNTDKRGRIEQAATITGGEFFDGESSAVLNATMPRLMRNLSIVMIH